MANAVEEKHSHSAVRQLEERKRALSWHLEESRREVTVLKEKVGVLKSTVRFESVTEVSSRHKWKSSPSCLRNAYNRPHWTRSGPMRSVR